MNRPVYGKAVVALARRTKTFAVLAAWGGAVDLLYAVGELRAVARMAPPEAPGRVLVWEGEVDFPARGEVGDVAATGAWRDLSVEEFRRLMLPPPGADPGASELVVRVRFESVGGEGKGAAA
jgi:hypothetical protein